jgi:hypothetical protein
VIHGMQEVRSSNLLSSTGQKHNLSTASRAKYSSKIQQRSCLGMPHTSSGSGANSHAELLAWPAAADTLTGLQRRDQEERLLSLLHCHLYR